VYYPVFGACERIVGSIILILIKSIHMINIFILILFIDGILKYNIMLIFYVNWLPDVELLLFYCCKIM